MTAGRGTQTGTLERMPISVNYISNLVELVAEQGYDVNGLLAKAGLTREEVYTPEAMLRFEQFRRLILGAREMTGDPGIGLRLGSQMSLTAHGLLGYAAMSSANLGEVVQLLLRYFNTRTRLLVPAFEREGRSASLILNESVPLEDVRIPYMEVTLASLAGALRFLVGERFDEARVHLPYPAPDYAERYQEVFAGGVHFNATAAAISVPVALLDVPFPTADRASRDMALKQCEEELRRLEAHESVAERIRRTLMTAREQLPTIEQLADHMAMTSRTLRRHLAAAGTSYKHLLEDVRRTRAIQALQKGMSVQQVAWELGYADPSNFARAFRKWTGHSPRYYAQGGS